MKIKKKKTRKERAKVLRMQKKEDNGQEQQTQEIQHRQQANIGVVVKNNKVALKLDHPTDLVIVDLEGWRNINKIVEMNAPKQAPMVRLFDAMGRPLG